MLRILSQTFWSSQGWRRPPVWPEPDALARAVKAGVMFAEPRELDHDGWVQAARNAAAAIQAQDAADAFLASLSGHRLDLRSALSSYAVAATLPEHPAPEGNYACRVCNQLVIPGRSPGPVDLNALSFERFKWGGVRLDDIVYVAFDLEQFAKAPRPTVTADDIDLGRQVITHLRELTPKTTAAQAAASLKMIPGGKYAREGLVDILGMCGILQAPGYPGYVDAFVPAAMRTEPSQRFLFGHYPTWWWRAEGGISAAALQRFLPRLE